MLSQLLEDKKKKPKVKTPSKKSKTNGRKEKARLLYIRRMRSIPTLSCSKPSSEKEGNSKKYEHSFQKNE